MTKANSLLRIILAVGCILAAVVWAVSGLLMLAASLRGQGLFGEHGTPGMIVLIVLWIAGMFSFVGGAVAMMRPAFHTSSAGSAASTKTRGQKR